MARLPSKSNLDGLFRTRNLPQNLPCRGVAMSWLRRSRHGLAEATIALVAIGVFGSLFVHVFRDIFSPDIAAIAPKVVRGSVSVACLVLVSITCLLIRRVCQSDVTLGWRDFSMLSGLASAKAGVTEVFFRAAMATCAGIISGGLVILVGQGTLNLPQTWIVTATTGCCLVAAMTTPRYFTGTRGFAGLIAFDLVSRTWVSPTAITIRWRGGLLMRQPATWGFWAAALGAFGAMAAASAATIPVPFVCVFAWLSGWFMAAAIAFQAASETTSIHFEYALGITPRQIARSHAGTSFLVAAISASMAAFVCILTNNRGAIPTAMASAAMAPSMIPFLLWQIDVRRPLIQMLTCLMASLFVATAIIATKAAFLLWPAVLVFLAQEQGKRLQARASGERSGPYT